jgi:hypothetical protein
MLSYELNCKHIMKLGDTAKWLPCHELAWEQPSIANIVFAQKHSGTSYLGMASLPTRPN